MYNSNTTRRTIDRRFSYEKLADMRLEHNTSREDKKQMLSLCNEDRD